MHLTYTDLISMNKGSDFKHKHVHFFVQICELHIKRVETAHFSISHLFKTLFSHDFPKLTLMYKIIHKSTISIFRQTNKFLFKKCVQITEVRVHKKLLTNLAREVTYAKHGYATSLLSQSSIKIHVFQPAEQFFLSLSGLIHHFTTHMTANGVTNISAQSDVTAGAESTQNS